MGYPEQPDTSLGLTAAGEEGAVVLWAQGSAAQESRPGGGHGPPGNPQTRGPLGQAELL